MLLRRLKIIVLILKIVATINEESGGSFPASLPDEYTYQTDPDMCMIYAASGLDFRACLEERHTRVLPYERHRTCKESRRQRCDLCKNGMYSSIDFLERRKRNAKYCLYVADGSNLTKLTTSVNSSL